MLSSFLLLESLEHKKRIFESIPSSKSQFHSLKYGLLYLPIVDSCNQNHITVQTLKEIGGETITTPPKVQKLERKLTLEKEHKDALERAVSLNIPHAVTSADEESSATTEERPSAGKEPCRDEIMPDPPHKDKSFCKNAKTNWNEVIEKLFNRNESGNLLLKRDDSESGSGSTADR